MCAMFLDCNEQGCTAFLTLSWLEKSKKNCWWENGYKKTGGTKPSLRLLYMTAIFPLSVSLLC